MHLITKIFITSIIVLQPFLFISCAKSSEANEINKLQTSIDASVTKNSDTGIIKVSKCPIDMVEIEGEYCPEVSQKCMQWLDQDQSPTANGGIGPMQCAEFEKPSTCLSNVRKHLHFCMDKFEYPGKDGSYPTVGINYYEAREIARKVGQRLCSKDEFNFACEGEEIHPYGYGDGYHRDATICNIDKPWVDYNEFSQSSWNKIDGGLYQAIKSDINSKCKSIFGVYNLNGNVDEILDSEKHKNVILSGGYWSVVRNRCRPQTVSHPKDFKFYQIGFRKCSDPK